MRFLVACGVAILIVATAKAIDVVQTPFGAQNAPPLWLPLAIGGFVLYGIGLALLFLTLGAHFATRAAVNRLAKWRVPLASAAIAAGAVIAGYVPVQLAEGLVWIIPEEQPRFLVVISVANLHLFADGLLLMALGVRVARITPPVAA